MIDEFWQMYTSCKSCHNQNIKFLPPQKAPSDINANIKLFSLGLETPNNDLALSQVNEWGSRVDSTLLCALWPLRPMAWPKAAPKGGWYDWGQTIGMNLQLPEWLLWWTSFWGKDSWVRVFKDTLIHLTTTEPQLWTRHHSKQWESGTLKTIHHLSSLQSLSGGGTCQ